MGNENLNYGITINLTEALNGVKNLIASLTQFTGTAKSAGDTATQSFDKAGGSVERLGMKVLGINQGIELLKKTVSAFEKPFELFEARQKALAGVDATLKSTGKSAQIAGAEVLQMAGQIRELNKYSVSTNEILDLSGFLLTFDNINKDVLPTATRLVIDLANRMKVDFRSAALGVGLALENPEEGLTRLGRSGIKFSNEEKEAIKSLVETGKSAEAQARIFDMLDKKVGGYTAATVTNFEATQNKIKATVGAINLSIGQTLMPIIETALSVVNYLVTGLKQVPPPLLVIIGTIGTLIPLLIMLKTTYGELPYLIVAVVAELMSFMMALKGANPFVTALTGALAALTVGIVALNASSLIASSALLTKLIPALKSLYDTIVLTVWLNPWLALIAVIAGAGVALYTMSKNAEDAGLKSAEAIQKQADEAVKLNETQKNLYETNIKQISSENELINKAESLNNSIAKLKQGTAERIDKEKQLSDILNRLQNKYPELIKAGDGYAKNQEAINTVRDLNINKEKEYQEKLKETIRLQSQVENNKFWADYSVNVEKALKNIQSLDIENSNIEGYKGGIYNIIKQYAYTGDMKTRKAELADVSKGLEETIKQMEIDKQNTSKLKSVLNDLTSLRSDLANKDVKDTPPVSGESKLSENSISFLEKEIQKEKDAIGKLDSSLDSTIKRAQELKKKETELDKIKIKLGMKEPQKGHADNTKFIDADKIKDDGELSKYLAQGEGDIYRVRDLLNNLKKVNADISKLYDEQGTLNPDKAKLNFQKKYIQDVNENNKRILEGENKTALESLKIKKDTDIAQAELIQNEISRELKKAVVEKQYSDDEIKLAEKALLDKGRLNDSDLKELENLNAKKTTVLLQYNAKVTELNAKAAETELKQRADLDKMKAESITDEYKREAANLNAEAAEKKRIANAEIINEQLKVETIKAIDDELARKLVDLDRKTWIDRHKIASAGIDALQSGFDTIWGRWFQDTRQAKDNWDALWLAMKNTFFQRIGEMISSGLIDALLNKLTGAKSNGGNFFEGLFGTLLSFIPGADIIKPLLPGTPSMDLTGGSGGSIGKSAFNFSHLYNSDAIMSNLRSSAINYGVSVSTQSKPQPIILQGDISMDLYQLKLGLKRLESLENKYK